MSRGFLFLYLLAPFINMFDIDHRDFCLLVILVAYTSFIEDHQYWHLFSDIWFLGTLNFIQIHECDDSGWTESDVLLLHVLTRTYKTMNTCTRIWLWLRFCQDHFLRLKLPLGLSPL